MGGALSGLLLISAGQFTRATLDSADYVGEILAITKANLSARNKAAERRAEIESLTPVCRL